MGGYGVMGFNSDSAGGGALDYVQDAFQDITVPANSNAGFSSTVSKNPLGYYLGNDCAPRYGAKVLWIKDLVPVDPNKSVALSFTNFLFPAYEIVWHEDFPQAKGYAFGAAWLDRQPTDSSPILNTPGPQTRQRMQVLTQRSGDGVGITGVIRRVQWILAPGLSASSMQLQLDGVNTTTLTVGADSVANSYASIVSAWDAFNAQTSNEDREIHDFRCVTTANYQTVGIVGAVVYFEVTGGAIDCFSGTTYLNKAKVSPVGTTLGLPTNTSCRGGRADIYATPAAAFGITTTFITDIVSNATGSSGTNLLSVSPGTGGSYPPGSMVFIPGVTDYIGQVLSRSSDSLTMGVTLPIGFSNSIYQLAVTGMSLAASQSQLTGTLWERVWDWDVTRDGLGGFTSQLSGATFMYGVGTYQDPWQRFRVVGTSCQVLGISGQLAGQSNGFPYYNFGNTSMLTWPNATGTLKVEGKFQALEFQWYNGLSGLLGGTILVNSLPVGISDNMSGRGFIVQRYLQDAGPGFNQVAFSRGAGFTGLGLMRITAYKSKVPNGPSFGVLSELSLGQTFLTRAAQNATLTAWGNIQRVYSDQLQLVGTWGREVNAAYAGGVRYAGGALTETGRFSYYGTQFCIVGTQGTSFTLTVNGTPTVATFNQWQGAALGLGFQTILFNAQTGISSAIEAIDFLSSDPEITSKQKFPDPILAPDEQTLTVVNGKVRVAQKGIRTQHLADGAVTPAKHAALNFVLATSSGTQVVTGVTQTQITNQTCTLTTSGRPVRIEFITGGVVDLNGSFFANNTSGENSAIAFIQILRNGTVVGSHCLEAQADTSATEAGIQVSIPPGALSFIDTTAPAGSHVYTAKMAASTAGGTAGVNAVRMLVYEL